MKTNFTASSTKPYAFTSFELLVTLAVIASCTLLILPAVGRTRASSPTAHCLNNLRQLSTAISMYAVENRDTMPGSSWNAVYGHYQASSQLRYGLINYLAPFLGAPASSTTLRRVDVADCPASLLFRKRAPSNAHIVATNVSYQLPRYVSNNPANPTSDLCAVPVQDRFPFGYPSQSEGTAVCGSTAFDYPGMKISNVKFPKTQWAIVDVDALNTISSTNSIPSGANYGQFLPPARVHMKTRNYLYFDGHAVNVKD